MKSFRSPLAPDQFPSTGRALHVVLVIDPDTGEIDVYGPHDEWIAVLEADRLRAELDALDLTEVWVLQRRLRPPVRLGPPSTGSGI